MPQDQNTNNIDTTKILKICIAILGVGISLFQIYTAGFGVFDAYLQRTIHLMTLMALAFIIKPTKKSWSVKKNAFIDIPLAGICLIIGIYLVLNHDRIATREWYWGPITSVDIWLGIITILLTLESARRIVGPALPIIAIVFIMYALFGHNLPYPFTIKSLSPLIFIDHLFLTTQGLFGIPVGVSATFVFLFILFGAFLEKTGASQFIIDFSMALVGKSTGGPAKVSIVASSLFGTISGHSVANVYGTGTITIPMMKKNGYSPEFAGAVEAASSAGGQIMPPIMGAAAFIMAEILGVGYMTVVKAALLPAILYYIAVFASCHFEALKLNLSTDNSEEFPDIKKILIEGFHFIIPLVVLVIVLVQGFTPFRAAFIATITLVIVASIRKSSRLSLKNYIEVFITGARNSVVIAVACACAGIIVGVLDVTGLGIKFVTIVTDLSMGIVPLLLFLVMFSCLILGMGVPTAPAYIVAAMIAAPTLVEFGIAPIAAHMFVFYSALLSAITPPVALAAYAGAALAEGKVMRTSIIASKLGFVKFFIPYMFVYNTALLMIGTPGAIIWSFSTAILGTISMVIAMEGYYFSLIGKLNRLFLGLFGLLLLAPEINTDIIGLIGFGIISFILHNLHKRNKSVNNRIRSRG
ncbi:TRAP transporter permease [Desulfobacula sp.]|uniref:TRAP transporter permease n=1 Tax=Desulfobacula sp. TaxID=2593537 RepID=UPI002714CF91|nr:TRAP transporter permease [Desulfobacula sp.]